MRTIYDMEMCVNRVMVGFMDVDTGDIKQFDGKEINAIKEYIQGRTLIGFNNAKFDDICLQVLLDGGDVWDTTCELINGDPWWHYDTVANPTIDLMPISGGAGSLKLKGARIGSHTIAELPYDPNTKHTKKMWKKVCEYNINDLKLTLDLYNYCQDDIKLREGITDIDNPQHLTSPQIAERKLKKFISKESEHPSEVVYKVPKIKPKCIGDIKEFVFPIVNGQPKFDQKPQYTIGETTYQFGLGGLHSMEKNLVKKGKLFNADVTSYYPSLIINFGDDISWVKEYKKFYERRLEIKYTELEESAILKLVLNGTFGKLGSIYSPLYAPELLVKVTLTGQLYLLVLIEMLVDGGFEVYSANTDGVECTGQSKKKLKKIVKKWEALTNLNMEIGKYKALYARDVNNYVAIYDGYAKRKGIFTEPNVGKNSEYPIVFEAVTQYYLNNTPIEETIKNCTDINMFAISRQVTGGAVYSDKVYPNTNEYEEYIKRVPFKQNKALEKRNEKYQRDLVLNDNPTFLGKVVRFYYSTNGYTLYYKKSGNRVPKSDGVRQLMTLEPRGDIDYERYIDIAKKLILE